jgi:phosphoribosylformylglycinamidine cyclo-ligase
MSSKYAETGVDVKKLGIEVFEKTVNNVFPSAFCVVSKDPDDPTLGLVTHADSAGSKPVQAYLNWKESGNMSCFRGLAQDVLAMNLNDVICVGVKAINFIDYIALNPYLIPKVELLKEINSGFEECFRILDDYDENILFSGGETADLPDQIRTLDVSGVVNGRINLSETITGEKISPGNIIIGLRSGGKTKYESKMNSGIMCNGLTLARLCLLDKRFQEKYPEITNPQGKGYYGRFKPDSYIDSLEMTVGEALVSPMRFYTPVVSAILDKCRSGITGLVHNMGGGLTKGLRIGMNINFVKDDLIELDPIFKLIQRESGETWKNMFENYNMGIGFEIISKKEKVEEILDISESFGLEAKIIGRCEKSDGENQVSIKSFFGKFNYK